MTRADRSVGGHPQLLRNAAGRLSVLLLGAVLAGFPASPAAAMHASTRTVAVTQCREIAVRIAVGAAPGAIAGTLCVPPGASTIQVLVAGNTYNRSYWQSDVEPDTYNYVRQANLAGYATLAVDRLGTGASLHPASRDMTLINDAASVQRVIAAVRAGTFGVFTHVVGVGHSLGSVVLNQVAGTHPRELDALVLTGFSHGANLANAMVRAGARYEFPDGDSQFAGRNLDSLYLETPPGGRTAFYTSGAVAPSMHAWDDHNRDTANAVELADLGRFQIPNLSRGIDSRVLIVDGSKDTVACGLASGDCADSHRLQSSEQTWFAPNIAVTAFSVPEDGHNVTMHRDAAGVNAAITAWINRSVGPGTGTRKSTPGNPPARPAATPQTPDPLVQAANHTLRAVTPGIVDAYVAAVEPVPGLGDGTNPVPAYNELLRTTANLIGPPGAAGDKNPAVDLTGVEHLVEVSSI